MISGAPRPRPRGSALPARSQPMARRKPLAPGAGLTRGTGLTAAGALGRRVPVKPISAKRARQNRERAAMADRRWPGRRDGTVLCAIWEAIQPEWCDRYASDLNEILPRGRGGSITSGENTNATCRPCNHKLTESPAWAYRLGFLKHDALCCEGREVCARYAEAGEAA